MSKPETYYRQAGSVLRYYCRCRRAMKPIRMERVDVSSGEAPIVRVTLYCSDCSETLTVLEVTQ